MSECVIRTARPEDAEALLEIYAPYVLQTAVTFEYDVPSVEEFTARIEQTLKRYPYLVAEVDGAVAGYAYASPFHARAAYGWDTELSIYLQPGLQRHRLGSRLYRPAACAECGQCLCVHYLARPEYCVP